MKKILLIILYCISVSNGRAQSVILGGSDPFCDPQLASVPACSNIIRNNNFEFTGSNIDDAYADQAVSFWNVSHGTPNLQDILIPRPAPSPATGYTFMGEWGEGIVGKMQTLVQGKQYIFSFFDAVSILPGPSTMFPEKFTVVLMKCPDYTNFPHFNNHQEPPLPSQSQVIYSESSPSNIDWQQHVISFTANDEYNMIWIFPDANLINSSSNVGVDFAYPELYERNEFEAISAPVSPNCEINLPPYCGLPVNAELVWNGPNGQSIPAAENTPQPLDASDPDNVGPWTLSMSIHGLNIQPFVMSIRVPACQMWPKVYNYARKVSTLLKDNNNIIASFGVSSINVHLNHIGPFPSIVFPSSSATTTFQYSNFGVTTWYKSQEDNRPLFITNNNDIQWASSPTNFYTNSTTGNLTVGPPIPTTNSERIIAEVNANEFITMGSNSIFVHGAGTSSISINSNVVATKFNSLNNKLFVINSTVTPSTIMNVYLLSNGVLNLTYSGVITTGNSGFVQIDNNDNLYYIDNSLTLKKYNYQTNTTTNVSIPNFNNSDVLALLSNNLYTENRCLIINKTESKFNSLDLSNLTCKKIEYSNLIFLLGSQSPSFGQFFYLYSNDEIYMAGSAFYNDLHIGNQTIPIIGVNSHSVFVTKFNLQNDFTALRNQSDVSYFRSGQNVTDEKQKDSLVNQFHFTISPNPAGSFLEINIADKESPATYSIEILTLSGKSILKRQVNSRVSKLNLSTVMQGSYYIVVTNKNNEQSAQRLIKL